MQQLHAPIFGATCFVGIAGNRRQVANAVGLKAASGNPVLADQRRVNGFSAPFRQCNIAVQPAQVVGVAHHTQLQGRARFEQLGDLIRGGF